MLIYIYLGNHVIWQIFMHKWQQPRTDAGGQVCFPGLGNVFRRRRTRSGSWYVVWYPWSNRLFSDSSTLLSPDILRESTYFCTRYHKAYSASPLVDNLLDRSHSHISQYYRRARVGRSSGIWWKLGWIATHMLSSNFFPFGNELEGCINSRRLRQRPIPHLPRVFSASAIKKFCSSRSKHFFAPLRPSALVV